MEPTPYLCFVEGNTPMRWFRSNYVRSLEQQVEDLKADKAELRKQLVEANAALAKALQVQEPLKAGVGQQSKRPVLASFPRNRDFLERVSANKVRIQEIEPEDRQENSNG